MPGSELTAVVSGGGTGLGRAIAAALARSCREVVIIGRRADRLQAARDEINDSSGRPVVRALAADLRSPAEVSRATEIMLAPDRPIDIVVNNAGGNYAAAAASDPAGLHAGWLANLHGNILPAVLLTHALLPSLRRPGGRIITVSSVAAVRGPASYGGAKAALHTWSYELAGRLASEGITVNVVAPGYVTGTEFYGERMNSEFHASRIALAPAGRGADPAEVASLVAYLAGPDAGFLTGQVIGVDGGALIVRTRR